MPKRSWLVGATILPLLLSSLIPSYVLAAPASVQVILDGHKLALKAPPQVMNGRTLVPVRGVLEAMNATVDWENETQTVTVRRGAAYVRMQVGRRLACLNEACTSAATLDIPPQIIGESTYVPVRFISQAIGVRVSWDQSHYSAVIETDKSPDYQFDRLTIAGVNAGQVIGGPLTLQVADATGTNVLYYLLDPATGKGPIIAAGPDTKAAYTFTPDPQQKGPRLLVAAVRQSDGTQRFSDPVLVQLDPSPAVQVTGVEAGGTITGPISIGNATNFVATKVLMRRLSADGTYEDLGVVGPGEGVTWYPQLAHNGDQWFQAVAYDRTGKEYQSVVTHVRVQAEYRTSLAGVSEGTVLNRAPQLSVAANYPVEYIRYFLDEQHLAWGYSPTWQFGPELNGNHTLRVEVMDKQGTIRNVGPYHFKVQASPQVWLSGVGPNQVVTGAVTLRTSSNVSISSVEYYLTDDQGRKELLGLKSVTEALTWKPTASHAGFRTIQAVAKDAQGTMISSEKVRFRVYLGTIYEKRALLPQDQFLPLATQMTIPLHEESGMSAAIQVAQAILETGWGQYVPVDKYTGQFSYNLFGIKRKGSEPSVIITTAEWYNGQYYQVDDYFRAYKSAKESFRDHHDFLMERPNYSAYRAVMTNPILAAWGLKQGGYATGPTYPQKLIDIINRYNLMELDNVAF